MRKPFLRIVFALSCAAALPVHAEGLYSYPIPKSDMRLPGNAQLKFDIESPRWPDSVRDYGSDSKEEVEVGIILSFPFK